MNQQSHGEATLSRLLATDWPDGLYTFEHGISRGRLMQEYLRRAAWWALELDATSKWPFFDIAGLWAPEVHSPPELAAQLEALIDNRIRWYDDARACRAALRWAAVLDARIPLPSQLEDPYESLLLIFERGGGFLTEHGFIDLGGSSVLQKTWRDHLTAQPVTSLDQATLDALDRSAETARPERPN